MDKKAFTISNEYKRCEKDLLEIIMKMSQSRAFYKLGYPSMYEYVNKRLGLSPAMTYAFTKVARKSQEVPELKKEIISGAISVSKAQKMTSVLNKKNQSHWLNMAKTQSHRQLEREVALADLKKRP